jgi:hypothetical protein
LDFKLVLSLFLENKLFSDFNCLQRSEF